MGKYDYFLGKIIFPYKIQIFFRKFSAFTEKIDSLAQKKDICFLGTILQLLVTE